MTAFEAPEGVVLDSYAVLAFLEQEEGAVLVEDWLCKAQAKKASLAMCVVNLGEVLYITERERGLAMARQTAGLLEQWPVEWVSAGKELAYAAAHIKACHSLAYADSYAAALAIQKQWAVMTGDPEFHSIEAVVPVVWLPAKNKTKRRP